MQLTTKKKKKKKRLHVVFIRFQLTVYFIYLFRFNQITKLLFYGDHTKTKKKKKKKKKAKTAESLHFFLSDIYKVNHKSCFPFQKVVEKEDSGILMHLTKDPVGPVTTPVTQRQPTRLATTNTIEINKRE